VFVCVCVCVYVCTHTLLGLADLDKQADQLVAVCSNVLQCDAVRCSILQCVAFSRADRLPD